ncbi:MAG: PHP domain-containing protein [Phycisphaerales bacterium]|nr:PHP domain-containing protein [Phycisphaerales bacterium]
MGGYAELAVTSNFTFLTGASHPEEFVRRAHELGYTAAAIADTNTLAGVVRAHGAAKEIGIPLAVGCRVVVRDEETQRRRDEVGECPWTPETKRTPSLRLSVSPSLSILTFPTTRPAYANLCRLLTRGKRRAPKGECYLSLDDLCEFGEGLLAVVMAPGEIGSGFVESLARVRAEFGDRASLAACCSYGPDDALRLRELADLAAATRVPLAAVNDARYHTPQRRFLQDVVTCIRHGCTIEEAGFRLAANAERHLKPPDEMARLFGAYPGAVERSVEIAARAAAFSLDELRYEYPAETCPPGMTPGEYLADRVWAGAAKRYPRGLPPKIVAQVKYELALIAELRYEAYFLTCHDIVEFARGRGIFCQGRGGAANSAVCYCLGITEVDPAVFSLLFERFVSRERGEPPDIDIDFEHERREEVIQYLYAKYGRDRAALTAEVISYRGRSAVREVGKAMGLSLDCVDALAKNISGWGETMSDERVREMGFDPSDKTIRQVIDLTRELRGFPRHLSQHVGGFVITQRPLDELVPIENAAMEDRTVIEWDKDDIDAMGMLKVDCLGLGMLTCIGKAIRLVAGEGTEGRRHGGTKGEDSRAAEASGSLKTADEALQDSVGLGKQLGTPGVGPQHAEGLGELQLRVDLGERGPGGPQEADIVGPAAPAVPLGDVGRDRDGGVPHLPGQPETLLAGHARRIPVHRTSELHAALPRDEIPECPDVSHAFPLRAFVPPCLRASSQSNIYHMYTTLAHNLCDPAVYDMICHADTIGVFQIESRAQMSMLPRLRPRHFYDLVIEVAIVRPGPIQGNMVHPYLRRRNGEDPVTYPNAAIEAVLGRTLGVPLFQEQAMQLSIVAAGFTPDEADKLRRAMAAWKRKGDAIFRFGEKLINGMLANGYPRDFAERCFEQIKGFSEYGFPESHAASFAILVYVSAWLKRHKPAAFAAALINSQPMGFYRPAQIIRDAQDHGVEVRPVDVNRSGWDCSLERDEGTKARGHEGSEPEAQVRVLEAARDEETERRRDGVGEVRESWGSAGPAIRLGMRLVKGLSQTDADRIAGAVGARGPFTTIEALWRASAVKAGALKKLAQADAFGSMGLDRQAALWQIRPLRDDRLPLFDQTDGTDEAGLDLLPRVKPGRRVLQDYESTGLSLKAHPVSFIRRALAEIGAVPCAELRAEAACPNGRRVKVAGLVLVRQRPGTASGVVFITLEDETGIANLILWPRVFERFRRVARLSRALLASGKVERQGEVVHVHADRLDTLDGEVPLERRASRDFH